MVLKHTRVPLERLCCIIFKKHSFKLKVFMRVFFHKSREPLIQGQFNSHYGSKVIHGLQSEGGGTWMGRQYPGLVFV